MQVWAGRTACASHSSNNLTLLNVLTTRYQEGIQVPVEGLEAPVVLDNYEFAVVSCLTFYVNDSARQRCANCRASGVCKVNSVVIPALTCEGVRPVAKVT